MDMWNTDCGIQYPVDFHDPVVTMHVLMVTYNTLIYFKAWYQPELVTELVTINTTNEELCKNLYAIGSRDIKRINRIHTSSAL